MRRLVPAFFLLFGLVLALSLPAGAHEGHEHAGVAVVQMEGPLDQRVLDFARTVIEEDGAALVVLRIDSPGVASGDVAGFIDAISSASIPVASWVGPHGARAYGGALQIAAATDYFGAAQGVEIGYAVPTVAGSPGTDTALPDPGFGDLLDGTIELEDGGELPGFVSGLEPSIGQFLASLDGREIGGFVVDTVERSDLADGSVVIVQSSEVRFLKPGLLTRFLRLSIRPEATFFFLAAGLSLAVFELYAAGVGVVAAVAGLSLFLSAYGLGVLPVRWWAVVMAVAGVLLYTWDFQRIRLGLRSLVGTGLLVAGGLLLTDAAPQFGPSAWSVAIVVIGIAAFYLFALTTVVRSRFSTPTIGREYLVGKHGVADTTFDPEGFVTVDGARWRGRAARAAEIRPGDLLTVTEVRGIVLEVDPAGTPASEEAPGEAG